MNVKSAIANFQLLVIYYAKELKNTLMLSCSTSAKNVGNNFHEKTIVIGMSQEKKSTVDKHFVQCLLQFYHRTSECLETFTVRVFTPEASERKFQRKMEEMAKNKEVKYGEMIIKVKQNLNLFGEIWGNDHQSKTESKFVLLIDENDKDLELNYNKLSIPPHRGRYESYSRQ